jgi:uncharacterized protein (TIRG00374 family)
MHFNWRRGLVISVGLSVLVALILVWKTLDLQALRNIGFVESGFLALAGAMLLAASALEGRRISLVAKAMGGKVRWFKGCTIFLSCTFAQLVTPMGLGEIPAVAYLLNKNGLRLGLSVAAAILRSFITKLVFSLGVILLFVFARGWMQFGPVTGELFTLVALVFAITLLLNAAYVLFPELLEKIFAKLPRRWRKGKFGQWQQRLEVEASEFALGMKILWARGPWMLLRIVILNLVFWLLWFGMLPVLARGLGVVADPVFLVSSQFILTLALPFIPVPGASGALELAMAAMYKGVIPKAVLGLFILCWRLFTYYLLLILGAISALGSLWGKPRQRGNVVDSQAK